MSVSYATQRKIRIIEERLGSNWKESRPNESIDAIYNDLMGDDRKNLFCKIDATAKDKLDSMTTFHKTGMADFIEQLIQAEWTRHSQRLKDGEERILQEFGG